MREDFCAGARADMAAVFREELIEWLRVNLVMMAVASAGHMAGRAAVLRCQNYKKALT